MNDQNEEHPIVLVACKRGTDQLTRGQACDSRNVYKLSQDGAHNVMYKCVKCGFSWNVPVGGAFTAC